MLDFYDDSTLFKLTEIFMQILIIGNGGREHALAWKCAQSAQVEKVFIAPGNAGTASVEKCQNVAIQATDIEALVRFATTYAIDLTIVGPEAPLVMGVVDVFTANGLKIFGPAQYAAQLEGSKAFAKDFFQRYHIPSASYAVFTDVEAAKQYIYEQGVPIVIKADGLAAGKGVVVAEDIETALKTVEDMLSGNLLGQAGQQVVIESFLSGEEASFIVLCDGKNALPLASSQDHKRVGDGDTGPNTGGMGAYSPAPIVTPTVHERVMREIVMPTLYGMQQEGCPYIGFLYVGLMIDHEGHPRVIEFNCRMGDPETQPILLRLESDLVTLINAALDHRLDHAEAKWDTRVALGVVMAAANYPLAVENGKIIQGLEHKEPDSYVFHAATQFSGKDIVTAGGRVLCVTALANTIAEAQQKAYQHLKSIHFEGGFYRHDIGFRALK